MGVLKEVPENIIPSIRLSNEEVQSHTLNAETLGEAVLSLHRYGLLVLENATDLSHIDMLNDILTKQAKEVATLETTHFNGETAKGGNIAQRAPRKKELMFEDIWANWAAVKIIESILGPKPVVTYALGNTALPGSSARQGVHADLTFNYPTEFPFSYVANVHLCDTNETNGATEVWPGSHLLTKWSNHKESSSRIQERFVEARRKTHPPLQAAVKKGAIVIRDLRLWHAGIPNEPEENEPRVMLAFVHFPWWFKNQMTIRLPRSTKEVVDKWSERVVYNAVYVDGEVDEKELPFAAVFSTENIRLQEMIPWSNNPVMSGKTINAPQGKDSVAADMGSM